MNAVESVTFFVPGVPAPQGSKRHVGGGRMVESSKALAPWRAAVTWYAAQTGAHFPGAVAVSVTFLLRRPPSAPRSRLWPCVAPDGDKLERAVLDGLTASGVIEDDARIVHGEWWKRYAEPGAPCGAEVRIEAV